jgi:hypothetical protein
MNTLTCVEILRPATIMCNILGTNPFTYKNGRLVYSKIRLLQVFLCFTSSILFAIFYFTHYKQVYLNVPKVVTFILMLRSLGWICTILLILVLTIFRFSKLTEVTASVKQVDSDLISLGQKDRIYKLGLQHRKILIFLLVLEQLVFNVLFDLHTMSNRNFSDPTFIGAFTYPRVACTTFHVAFIVYTIIIQKRFEIVNELLDACVNKSNGIPKNSINQLIYLHKILYKTSKDLNSVFSLQLLMWFGTCFLLTLWDLHSAIHTLLLEQIRWSVIEVIAKNISYNVFDLFYLSKRCANLCYEVINHTTSSKLFTFVILGEFYQNFVAENSTKYYRRGRQKFCKFVELFAPNQFIF